MSMQIYFGVFLIPVAVRLVGDNIFADLSVPFSTDFPAHAAELQYRKNAWGQQPIFIVLLNWLRKKQKAIFIK